ncbi:hypothetical protein JOD54_006156 [Actinokineospora baliensis]|nr:hypothetical protein [Actinokineospora baliensis]MBM7775952.1 hypothetical protein [Actinokineospora baliensis]
MDLTVNPLDLLPAVEQTGDEPQLLSSCCSHCFSSMMLVTNGCEW